MRLNLYQFLVVKPFVWAKTHLEGAHVEDSAEAEITALEPQVLAELTKLINPEVAAIVTSTDITVTQVSQALAPKAAALADQAIANLTVPAEAKAQIIAFANIKIPDIIGEVFTDVVDALTPAS